MLKLCNIQIPLSVNKVLLEYNHSFIPVLSMAVLCYNDRAE